MGDGVGGGCWGVVLWEEDVMGDVVVGGGCFSSFSYLSSMYMYMCTSPLAPSDVSSPLVVMATSSSITVTGRGGGASAHVLGVPRPQSSTCRHHR